MMEEKKPCPLHKLLEKKVDELDHTQKGRVCGERKIQIENLEKENAERKKENEDQWTAINQLRRTVWGWSPLMSFLGSVLGAILIGLILAHFRK